MDGERYRVCRGAYDSPRGTRNVPCQQCSWLAIGFMKQGVIHTQSGELRVVAESSCFHSSVR